MIQPTKNDFVSAPQTTSCKFRDTIFNVFWPYDCSFVLFELEDLLPSMLYISKKVKIFSIIPTFLNMLYICMLRLFRLFFLTQLSKFFISLPHLFSLSWGNLEVSFLLYPLSYQ
jgi:hypothetical protein